MATAAKALCVKLAREKIMDHGNTDRWMISSLFPHVASSWPSFVTWTLLALCVMWPSVAEARPTVEVNENEAGRPNLSWLQRRVGTLCEGCVSADLFVLLCLLTSFSKVELLSLSAAHDGWK